MKATQHSDSEVHPNDSQEASPGRRLRGRTLRSVPNALPQSIMRQIEEWVHVRGGKLPHINYTASEDVLRRIGRSGAKPAVWVDSLENVLTVALYKLPSDITNGSVRFVVVEGDFMEACIVSAASTGRGMEWQVGGKSVRGTGYKRWVGLEGDSNGFENEPSVFKIAASDLEVTSPTATAPSDPRTVVARPENHQRTPTSTPEKDTGPPSASKRTRTSTSRDGLEAQSASKKKRTAKQSQAPRLPPLLQSFYYPSASGGYALSIADQSQTLQTPEDQQPQYNIASPLAHKNSLAAATYHQLQLRPPPQYMSRELELREIPDREIRDRELRQRELQDQHNRLEVRADSPRAISRSESLTMEPSTEGTAMNSESTHNRTPTTQPKKAVTPVITTPTAKLAEPILIDLTFKLEEDVPTARDVGAQALDSHILANTTLLLQSRRENRPKSLLGRMQHVSKTLQPSASCEDLPVPPRAWD